MKYLTVALLLLVPAGLLSPVQEVMAQEGKVQIAKLSGDRTGFESIRTEFKKRNPGYDMAYHYDTRKISSGDHTRVVFVQEIEGITNQDQTARATVTGRPGAPNHSEAIVGDIIILQKGEMLETDVETGLLVFDVPREPGAELPGFIRPDWDPKITDVPGGCATDIDAYRRILLTWREEVGTYIYHALNAHRVRIRDSFSHYHPAEVGFDEFYLVQMTEPGARIITSEQTALIKEPGSVEKAQVEDLMQEYDLEVGDLIYLPRGVVHRGVGGVVAQVITVPGFIPGSEIGVDHHLRAINERLGLAGKEALPYNVESSDHAVIR
ncbi:MAG: cupin domain-containing protein [Balneolales bacterium]